jgi:hypothetical protein
MTTDADTHQAESQAPVWNLRRIVGWAIAVAGAIIFVGSIGGRARNLIDGIELLVKFVDAYRAVVYPIVDSFVSLWPYWIPHPSKEQVDVFFITLAAFGYGLRGAYGAQSIKTRLMFFILLTVGTAMGAAAFYVERQAIFVGLVPILVAFLYFAVLGLSSRAGFHFLMFGLLWSALIGLRLLNAHADTTLPIVERWWDAGQKAFDDLAGTGRELRPK